MAKFVSVNCGAKPILVNLDCSVQGGIQGPFNLPRARVARTISVSFYEFLKHFMNYLIAKYSEWENNTNRKKTVAEQAIARVRASNTTLLSISRKPRGAVNLDECIVDYDFVDSDGTLMDLSVRCASKRDRAFNYLTRKYIWPIYNMILALYDFIGGIDQNITVGLGI